MSGKTASVSMADICKSVVNPANARRYLSKEDSVGLQNQYEQLLKDSSVKEMSAEEYDQKCHEIMESFEIYGPHELFSSKVDDKEAGLVKKKEWDKVSRQGAEQLYNWIEAVSHVAGELSKEYEQNKNVFVFFLMEAIADDEQAYLEKQNQFKGETGYVFLHAVEYLPELCRKEYPRAADASFRMGMKGYYEKIHQQSEKWASGSEHLSVCSFDIYQILMNELGSDFMKIKDDEGDSFADVIMSSFAHLIEHDIPSLGKASE